MINTMTEADGLATLCRRLDDRSWWTILAPDEKSNALAQMIESTYYDTPERAVEFDMLVIPRPFPGCVIMGVYFAKKKWMVMSQLKSLMEQNRVKNTPFSDEADIIVVPTQLGIAAAHWLDAILRTVKR